MAIMQIRILEMIVVVSGRILDHLGDMKAHDKEYAAAEAMLTKALQCMEQSNSNIGKATVLYHIGYLRYTTHIQPLSVYSKQPLLMGLTEEFVHRRCVHISIT